MKIKMFSPSDFQKIQNYIKMGHTSTLLLLSLVEDVLDMSKIEAGTFKVNYGWFSVKELIEETYELFTYQCTQKKIQLNLSLHPKLFDVFIESDKGRVKQVLLNLMSNSLKFTFQGHIHLSANFYDEDEESIEFEVSDTGMGIKDEEQDEVFQMFGMASSHKEVNMHGWGIGLKVSKTYIEILGGEIWINSKFGEGTNVKFIIPNKSLEPRLDRNKNCTIDNLLVAWEVDSNENKQRLKKSNFKLLNTIKESARNPNSNLISPCSQIMLKK